MRWLLLNDRLCEMLGYSRDELLGKTFVDITHPDDREASPAAARKLLAGEISSWAAEKRYIRKDGVTVWARAFVSLVRDRQNQPLYFIRVAEDITEKIHAERALQESRRELRAMARRLINAQEEERFPPVTRRFQSKTGLARLRYQRPHDGAAPFAESDKGNS